MAEIAAGFLGPAIEVVRWFGAPIVRQFNYLCCFTSNINNLRDEAEKLDDAAGEVQVRVDRAVDDVQVIVPRVVTWIEKSNDINGQTSTILDEVPNVGSGCLKVRARFSLSRRAKKTTDRMKELRDECSKFDVISLPGPPAARGAVEMGKTYEFESRKQIEEEIMMILKGGVVNTIGICGMGGLGKTTMTKRIMNRALKERVFEETVIAVVSQQVKKADIQLEIGGSLGVNIEVGTPEAVRVQKLHTRLSGTKRILLVLDDIWEGLELEEFGIPRDSRGCTILITSRNRDALRATGVQKEFGMKILSDDEAWFLFRESAGTCVDDTKLKSIADGVVKECEGLPIALATVGAALKDEKNPSIWEDALRQLSQCDPDIPYFIAKVYHPLKLSYDFLSSKQAKSIFLLCCLFPEDAYISVERLTYFGMGLGVFEGVKDLEEARNRMSMLITMLKSRSLLLDSQRKDHVRMHDVIRDVCIFIAKREGYMGGKNCTWISSFELLGETSKLHTGLGFPNLHLLFLSHSIFTDSMKEEFIFDSAFFEGIRNLYVLCIQYYNSLTSLPLATNSFKNLNSLVLDSCKKLESISFIGEFVNLEIFICRDCDLIEELPSEIKRLNRLKLLELTWCLNLKRIGRDIISSLVGLEELKMLHSFCKWETGDREERENAGLSELEALTNLRCLEIEIEDPELASQKLHLSSKIKRFSIILSPSHRVPGTFVDQLYDKSILLELKREETCLGNWIGLRLLRDTEYLHLSGNGANRVELVKCQNIRWLELGDCESMKNIITTSVVDDDTAFPASLEHLELSSLPELEGICDGPISSTSFNNLESLQLRELAALKQLWKSSSESNYVPPLFTNLSSIGIYGCPCLRSLEQLSIAGKDCLPQLQSLSIWSCDMMEQVFLCNEEEDENSESRNHRMITKVFPKLKKVDLRYLPNMTTFYQGIGGIKFPLLTRLSIMECPKLKSMVGSDPNSGGSSLDIDDDSSNFLCEPKKVSFGNLKELKIDQWNPFCSHKIPLSLLNGLEQLTFYTLHGCMSLFSYSVATNLVNLRVLNIRKCDVMLKLIEDSKEEKVVSCGEMALLFPKLEELQLEDLPKLVTFCKWKCDVKLPLLKKVVIMRCPHMENFSLGILAAPKLEAFTTDVNNNLEIGVNVSFDNLEKLEITESEKPFYGHKFFISLSYGLKVLKVYKCHGSTSCLFTSSIARNLDRLEALIIDQCSEFVKVIEDEGKKEKVAERTLLFPKLKELRLNGLPLMVSFCEWKCDIELPSLRYVCICACPVLKIFTMGSIAIAPNLENVQIDYYEDIDGTKDLNIALQLHLARVEKREEKMKKKKKEGREEEGEVKGEIEETQN